MIGALRSSIHGLLADPPACPHCGSGDVRRSHQPSRLAPLGLCRLRCRACQGLFFLRASQVAAAEARAAEYPHAGRHKHHARPPSPAEAGEPAAPADPVDLEAIERQLAAARAHLQKRE